MIDLKKIETFLRCAETLNISDAAKQLHMTQPSVSAQIHALENDLKVELFTRLTTGLRLTEEGRLLLPWAHRVSNETRNLLSVMSSVKTDVVGELRIGCSTTSGKYILPQMAARFCRHFPRIRVTIQACTPEDIMLKLLEGEVQVGVLSREVDDESLDLQQFFWDRIMLIVPAEHRWAHRKSIEPAELLDEPLIMREETSGTRRVLLSELAKFDIGLEDLNVFMQIGNSEAIVRTVAAGYGISFISKLASDCALEEGRIHELEVEGLNLRRMIYMVRKKSVEPSRPRDAFWSFIHTPENADLIQLPEGGE
jgi:DNA-binding transcriptional LysR family regulator